MLPDMLCLRTPVRWLEARGLPAPPKLLDWLITLVALSECPLTSYGALVNFQGFLKGEVRTRRHDMEMPTVLILEWNGYGSS
jgi:hypothetical protein